MSVVSANDQTARDRSPVHGLRGFVCFRESRLVTCVVIPVSFQHCTAAAYAILNQFCVSYWVTYETDTFTMARSPSSFVFQSTVIQNPQLRAALPQQIPPGCQ